MNYIIIGGGVAGISAAKAIREHDSHSEIMVYTSEIHPLGFFARKDMARRLALGSYDADDLLLESDQHLAQQEIRLEYQPVLRVFPARREILKAHNIRRGYDRLLLAMGATPRLIDAPGLHLIGVHQVRNYEDVWLIESWMDELRARGAVIIGGGILGLDMAYALRRRGVPTTLVVREPTVGTPLLPESAGKLLEKRLQADNVRLILGQTVTAYLSDDDRMLDAIRLSDGEIILTRMALCAVGVHPRTDIIDGTDIAIDEATGAIPVNLHMQTNLPDVFAAGNCALANGHVAHNWTLSAEQGRIAGLNMVGQAAEYAPALYGDAHSQIYDLPFAYWGRRAADAEGLYLWTWSDGDTRFAQVIFADAQVVGVTLIGDVISAAPALLELEYERPRRRLPPEQVRALLEGAGVSPMA